MSVPGAMSLTSLDTALLTAEEAWDAADVAVVEADELQPAIARPLAAARATRTVRREVRERTMGLLVCRGQAV